MQDTHSERMSSGETRAAGGLALVFAFRMLGMFMVLPVLATYGMDLAGASPALIGLAIGAYGLTQAVLQIPFGIISDRIGRRPVIYLGLIILRLAAWWRQMPIRSGESSPGASCRVPARFPPRSWPCSLT